MRFFGSRSKKKSAEPGSAAGVVPAYPLLLANDPAALPQIVPDDLDTGVVFIKVEPPPRVGARVTIALTIDQDPPVSIDATVVWTRQPRQGLEPGFGARLNDLGAALAGRLRDLAQAAREHERQSAAHKRRSVVFDPVTERDREHARPGSGSAPQPRIEPDAVAIDRAVVVTASGAVERAEFEGKRSNVRLATVGRPQATPSPALLTPPPPTKPVAPAESPRKVLIPRILPLTPGAPRRKRIRRFEPLRGERDELELLLRAGGEEVVLADDALDIEPFQDERPDRERTDSERATAVAREEVLRALEEAHAIDVYEEYDEFLREAHVDELIVVDDDEQPAVTAPHEPDPLEAPAETDGADDPPVHVPEPDVVPVDDGLAAPEDTPEAPPPLSFGAVPPDEGLLPPVDTGEVEAPPESTDALHVEDEVMPTPSEDALADLPEVERPAPPDEEQRRPSDRNVVLLQPPGGAIEAHIRFPSRTLFLAYFDRYLVGGIVHVPTRLPPRPGSVMHVRLDLPEGFGSITATGLVIVKPADAPLHGCMARIIDDDRSLTARLSLLAGRLRASA